MNGAIERRGCHIQECRGSGDGLRSPDAAQRAVLHGVVRCRAGAVTMAASVTVPVQRSGMKHAASRPGHEGLVIAGLDPAIHPLRKALVKMDGYAGQTRV